MPKFQEEQEKQQQEQQEQEEPKFQEEQEKLQQELQEKQQEQEKQEEQKEDITADYYYGLGEGLAEFPPLTTASLNEFTQFIVMKPYTWLVEKVPNLTNFLTVFSNLINNYNGAIGGGYLRRAVQSGDALQFQNADIDFWFLLEIAALLRLSTGCNGLFQPTWSDCRLSFQLECLTCPLRCFQCRGRFR